jgi:hypothetical protein
MGTAFVMALRGCHGVCLIVSPQAIAQKAV